MQLVLDEVSCFPAAHEMQLESVWLEDDWYWPLLHVTHEPLDTLLPAPQLVDEPDDEMHDQLADQPDRATLLSVVNRTRM